MVKNLPSNAGDKSSIPGWGTKIPHALRQLSLCTSKPSPRAATTEPTCLQVGSSLATHNETENKIIFKK